jgi:hypothetical protein
MKPDPIRDAAVDLMYALKDAASVIESLEPRRIFMGRIQGYRDLVKRSEKVLR